MNKKIRIKIAVLTVGIIAVIAVCLWLGFSLMLRLPQNSIGPIFHTTSIPPPRYSRQLVSRFGIFMQTAFNLDYKFVAFQTASCGNSHRC